MSITQVAIDRTVEIIRHRKRDYGHAFLSPAGQAVLGDLAKFCRATETCFDADPRLHAVAEGRREVWLRIQRHLNLSSEQLFLLANGKLLQQSGQSQEDTPNG